MYSLNLLSRLVLITPDEVIARINITAIDSHKLLSAIEIAEERFVRPVLGSDLYEDMISQKNVIVTEDNKEDLQTHITLKQGNGIYQLQDDDIVNAWELMTETTAYQDLWKQRLWSFVAECVYSVAIPENYAQFSTAGIMKNNPIGSVIGDKTTASVGIDLKDLKYLNDKQLLERVNVLQRSLEEYLCKNLVSLLKYPAKRCQSCNDDGHKKDEKKTSWVTGIYDHEDNNRRRIENGWGWD